MTASSRRVPTSQDWITQPMKQSGLVSDEGVCFGVSAVARDAILAGTIQKFNQHVINLQGIPPDQFPLITQAAIQQRLAIVTEARNEIRSIFQKNISVLEEGWELKALTADQKKEFDSILEARIEEKIASLPQQNQAVLRSLPFLETVEAYHQGYLYDFLFEENTNPLKQDAILLSPMLMPQALEEKGGIKQLQTENPLYGIYSEDELTTYLQSLKEAMQGQADEQLSFSMMLSGSTHTITVGYDNKLGWVFVDANRMPVNFAKHEREMAKRIGRGLYGQTKVAFAADIYIAKKDDSHALKERFLAWRASSEMQKMHEITLEKVNFKDKADWSLVDFAADTGDKANLEKIFSSVEDKDTLEKLLRANQYTALGLAAYRGHEEIVKMLLAKGVYSNEEKLRAIQFAASGNHPGIIDELSKELPGISSDVYLDILKLALSKAVSNANLKMVNKFLSINTAAGSLKGPLLHEALTLASERGYEKIVNALLSEGAVPGLMAIIQAAAKGHRETVKVLLKAAPSDSQNFLIGAALNEAATAGHLDVIIELLNSHQVKRDDLFDALKSTSLGGHTDVAIKLLQELTLSQEELTAVLAGAAVAGKVNMLKLFLNQGAKPDVKTLALAIKGNDAATVQLLLESDVDYRLSANTDLLMRAIKNNNLAIVEALVAHGAKPNLANDEGVTPLHIAAEKEDMALLRVLLETQNIHQAYVFSRPMLLTARNQHGDTVMHIAAKAGNTEMVSYLDKLDTHLKEMLDNQGETIAHLALHKGDVDLFNTLMNLQLDVNNKDQLGNSLLHEAVKGNFGATFKIIDTLIKQGADVNAVNNQGETPLYIVSQTPNRDLIQKLLAAGAKADQLGKYSLGTPIENAIKHHQWENAAIMLSSTKQDLSPQLMKGLQTSRTQLTNGFIKYLQESHLDKNEKALLYKEVLQGQNTLGKLLKTTNKLTFWKASNEIAILTKALGAEFDIATPSIKSNHST